MGESESYTRLERDSFGVERMVTYNSAGECIGIADPVLDEEGRIRFVPRPDFKENSQELEGQAATVETFPTEPSSFVPSESAPGSDSATSSGSALDGVAGEKAPSGSKGSEMEPWWSNPKHTPALVIASVFAGAIFFLGLSLVYRMIVNPSRPESGSEQTVRRMPDPQPNGGYEQPTPPVETPGGSGRDSYPPMPQEPAPDPYSGTMPNDLGPTDPAMEPTVPDPMLAPGESVPESKPKPKETEKKPIDLRGDDEDSGSTSAMPPADAKSGTESKTGSGPDLRGSGE